ncbi:MAG: hypothetical protein V3U84_05335 [Thiotrichaceae bacterium]
MEKNSRRRFLGSLLSIPFMTLSNNVFSSSGMISERKASWQTLQASELENFIGDEFVIANEGQGYPFILESIDVQKKDPGRPAFLMRQRGFVASFEPIGDYQAISVDENCRVHHPSMGSDEVFFTKVPTRRGKIFFECVFN